MATPPIPTPQTDPNVTNTNTPPPTQNAQGVSNPPAALPANGNTDPSQGVSSTNDSTMVSNAPQSGTTKPGQSQTSSQDTSQQPNGLQPSTSSSNAQIPQQPTKPLPALSAQQPDAQHPSVQRAGVIHSIATALAGGPRFTVSVDPSTGKTVQTPVPLSRGDISMAIVSEALSGALSGLSVAPGPGNIGRAAGAGFGQVQGEMQQADQQNQDQAQQDFKDQVKAKAAQGAAFESNSRARLNTIQAEQGGIKILQAAANQNSDLLAQQEDQNNVLESHVSQDAINAGMASGKYHAGQNIGIPDGWVMVGDKPEQTFSIIRDPALKVPMSQETWDTLANQGDPQHARGVKLGTDGAQVTTAMASIANQKIQARSQMNHDISQFTGTLTGSKDPNTAAMGAEAQNNVDKYLSDPQSANTGHYLLNRLQRFRAYAKPGSDMYQTLQQMQQAVPDPANPGKMKPSPYAQTADQLAGMFGGGDVNKGWSMLQAADQEDTPTQIKNEAQARAIQVDPTSSPKAVRVANAWMASNNAAQAAKAAQHGAGKGAGGDGGAPKPGSDAYKALIQGAYTGNIDLGQAMRYGKPFMTQLTADTLAAHPDFQAGQFKANQSLLVSGTSGKIATNIAGMNALSDHIKDGLDGIARLNNTNSAWMNTPLNDLRSKTNDPQIGPAIERLLAVKSQLLTVLDNGKAAHDADLQQMRDALNTSQTPNQMRATLQQAQTTAQIQAKAQNDLYRSKFGKDANGYRPSNSDLKQRNPLPQGAKGYTKGPDGNVNGYMDAQGHYQPLGGK